MADRLAVLVIQGWMVSGAGGWRMNITFRLVYFILTVTVTHRIFGKKRAARVLLKAKTKTLDILGFFLFQMLIVSCILVLVWKKLIQRVTFPPKIITFEGFFFLKTQQRLLCYCKSSVIGKLAAFLNIPPFV